MDLSEYKRTMKIAADKLSTLVGRQLWKVSKTCIRTCTIIGIVSRRTVEVCFQDNFDVCNVDIQNDKLFFLPMHPRNNRQFANEGDQISLTWSDGIRHKAVIIKRTKTEGKCAAHVYFLDSGSISKKPFHPNEDWQLVAPRTFFPIDGRFSGCADFAMKLEIETPVVTNAIEIIVLDDDTGEVSSSKRENSSKINEETFVSSKRQKSSKTDGETGTQSQQDSKSKTNRGLSKKQLKRLRQRRAREIMLKSASNN